MPKRRPRADCLPMPAQLTLAHVSGVYSWPLGATMTRKAAGTGWTDCLVVLVDGIRLGGKYGSRRVRYDGRLYITAPVRAAGGRSVQRVYLDAEVTALALDCVSHVYGFDAESDVLHNFTLKGY